MDNEAFIKQAFQAGLTEAQVRAAVAERNTSGGQPPPQSPQPSTSGANPLMDFLGSLTKPVRVAGEGIADLGRLGAYGVNKVTDALSGQNTADQHLINQPPTMMVSPQEANTVAANATNPNPLQNSAVKETAGLASFVPILRGAGVVGALGNGAVTGALSGVSQDNATPTSVGENALVGGATGGALHGLGALFNKAGSAVGGAGTAIKDFGGRQLLSQYAGANKNLESGGADAIKNLADNYGIYNANTVAKVAPQLVGKDGLLSGMVREGVQKAGPVDVGGVTKQAQTLMDKAYSVPDPQAKKIMDMIKGGLAEAAGGQDGQDITGADPHSVFKFTQSLGSEAARYYNSFERTGAAADQEVASVLSTVRQELNNRLFTGVDSTGNVTENGVDNLRFQPTAEQLATISKLNPHVAAAVKKAGTYQGLRHLEADLVEAGKAAEVAGNRAGTKPINSLATIALMLNPHLWPVVAASTGINSKAGQSIIGGTAIKAGQRMQGAGSSQVSPNLQALIEALGAKTTTSGYQQPK